MYRFIGKDGHFYEIDIKENANCPDSEKSGTGPGSCGGRISDKNKNLDISSLLSRAKIPRGEPPRIKTSYKEQSTIKNLVQEASRHNIILIIDGLKDENNDVVNRAMTTAVFYKENFPELRTQDVQFSTTGVPGYARSFTTRNGMTGIRINSNRVKNSVSMKKLLRKDVESGYHPIGCDTIQSVIDHELGHELDKTYHITDTTKKDSQEFYNIISNINFNDIPKELSRYAKEGFPEEFLAEAWSEYRNNPKPRPIAKAIGDLIMKKSKMKQ